jgi:formamidopyrimidine-DNA glycosylase
MPELPEVETVVRKLRPHVVGRQIQTVELLWQRTVDRLDPQTFASHLTGARVISIGRRGKFICFNLDTGQTWLVHLRMTGKFFICPVDSGECYILESARHWNIDHVRARFFLESGLGLVYVDMRKFGRFYLVDDPQEIVGALGPEPLGDAFTVAWLTQALQGRKGEIKRLLLNQHFLAGLGNIYVSEALWRARIHPQRRAGSLTEEESARLHAAIVSSLRAGLSNGGTSLDDRQYVYPDGGLGDHQSKLVVYDRAGEQCPRCGYEVQRMVQGQRSTYFCPICQSVPADKRK